MKKVAVVILLLVATSQVFALTNEELAQKCWEKGVEKVILSGQHMGCEIYADQVEVQEVDNRSDNPSKYIWYQSTNSCNGIDRVVKIVKYYNGKCF